MTANAQMIRNYIHMEECGTIIRKRKRIIISHGIKLEVSETIKEVGKEIYQYLCNDESDKMYEHKMKDMYWDV